MEARSEVSTPVDNTVQSSRESFKSRLVNSLFRFSSRVFGGPKNDRNGESNILQFPPQPQLEQKTLVSDPPAVPKVDKAPSTQPQAVSVGKKERVRPQRPVIEEPVVSKKRKNQPSQAQVTEVAPVQLEQDQKPPTIKLTPEQFPWLDQDVEITLNTQTIPGTGQKYYLGDAILGGDLEEVRNLLGEKGNQIAQKLLQAHLPDILLRRYNPHVRMVDDVVIKDTIYAIKNQDGIRVYVTRGKNIEELPVVLVLAMCKKEKQIEVLSRLTNNFRKTLKQRGRL